MRPTRTLLVATLLLALPLAGCFGAEETPNERAFTASGGKVSAGWAYDGAGLEAGSASLQGSAQNAENTANVTATFTYAGSEWSVFFDQVAPSADFQDGGVAFELVEHGDTGVADASIPTILAKVAIWGSAKVARDGAPALGPSGKDAWSAHLMVSDTTVRGADGKIAKADGATPYDPAAPGDARRVEGDAQAFLVLRGPDGADATRPDLPVTGSAAFVGPETTQTIDIPAEKGGKLTLNLTADGGSNPAGVGQVRYVLVDAEGNEVASVPQGPVLPNQPHETTLEVEDVPGPLTLQATGQGSFTVRAEGVVTYDDHPFLVITWDDVTLT